MGSQKRSCDAGLRYHDYYKVVVTGDSGVGKTDLLSLLSQEVFAIKSVKIDDKVIKVQMWDTAGQVRFPAITHSFYRGAVGALILYDITRHSSFKHVPYWLQELKKHTDSHVVKMLVGNKTDQGHLRLVRHEDGRKFAEENDMIFIETSLDTTNVEEAFNNIIQEIYKTRKLRGLDKEKEERKKEVVLLEDGEKRYCCTIL